MDDVVKVAAVLDKSAEGRSGVNNNVHYNDADGCWGGTLIKFIMDEESVVLEALPLSFFSSRCRLWR